jgi:hypothetical protein
MMDINEYDNFRKAVEDVFNSLYVVDVGSLTSDERKQHQELLAAAYLAVVRLENKSFSDLTEQANQKLESLSAGILTLQQQLEGLEKVNETLEIIASSLDLLTSVSKLLN